MTPTSAAGGEADANVAANLAVLDGLGLSQDRLGEWVREAWVRWARRQPNPKAHGLLPWAELAEADRQADREIGTAVALFAILHDRAARVLPSPTPAVTGEDFHSLIAEAARRIQHAPLTPHGANGVVLLLVKASDEHSALRRHLAQAEATITTYSVGLDKNAEVIAELSEKVGLAEERATTAERQLDEVSAALPGVQFMDPPDGGDVSLGEQVRRMAEALATAERRLEDMRLTMLNMRQQRDDYVDQLTTSQQEVARLRAVEEAARRMPRATPAAGAAGPEHQFTLTAATVWALDLALTALDRHRAALSTPHQGTPE